MADRLTDEATWDILSTPLDKPVSGLATKWGVSHQTIRACKRLETDKAKAMYDLMQKRGDPVFLLPPASKDRRGSLTDDQVRTIRTSAISSAAMAKQIGVSASMVRMIRTRQTYNHVKD